MLSTYSRVISSLIMHYLPSSYNFIFNLLQLKLRVNDGAHLLNMSVVKIAVERGHITMNFLIENSSLSLHSDSSSASVPRLMTRLNNDRSVWFCMVMHVASKSLIMNLQQAFVATKSVLNWCLPS